MQYSIIVDDFDRDECPNLPWSASVLDADGKPIGTGEAGLGRTPAEAVEDAIQRNLPAT